MLALVLGEGKDADLKFGIGCRRRGRQQVEQPLLEVGAT